MEELSPVERLALSRLFDPRNAAGKRVRAEVESGEYDFDFAVRVEGRMIVRKDYPQNIVAKARPWVLLMLLAEKVNEAKLTALLRESEQISKDDPRLEDFKERVNAAMQTLKAPTKTECKGKVDSKAVVTPLGHPTLAA